MPIAEDAEIPILHKQPRRCRARQWLRPGRVLVIMVLMVLVTEGQHLFLPEEAVGLEVLLETGIMFAFLLPLYFFVYRPAWLELQHSEHEIRSLSRQLIRAEEKTRKNLACDLHDEFGQVLTALQFGVENVCSGLNADQHQLAAQCGRLSSMIAQLGNHVRDITAELRPTMLDNVGLVPALHCHAKQFETMHPGVTVLVLAGEKAERLPPDVEISLYRVCQESLNNVAKHARARQVRIDLQRTPKLLTLTIKDDGVGFAAERERDATISDKGFGILGMRERIADLGGQFEVVSRPGKGTEVRVRVPLNGRNVSQ
jgi:signal transduction histidine kinase